MTVASALHAAARSCSRVLCRPSHLLQRLLRVPSGEPGPRPRAAPPTGARGRPPGGAQPGCSAPSSHLKFAARRPRRRVDRAAARVPRLLAGPGEDATRGCKPPAPPLGAAGKLRPPGPAGLRHSDPGPPASASRSPPGSECAGSTARQPPREGAGGRRAGGRGGARGGERGRRRRRRRGARGHAAQAPGVRAASAGPRLSEAQRSPGRLPGLGPGPHTGSARRRPLPLRGPSRPRPSAGPRGPRAPLPSGCTRPAALQPPGGARAVSRASPGFKGPGGPGPLAPLPQAPTCHVQPPRSAAPGPQAHALRFCAAPRVCPELPWKSKRAIGLGPLGPLRARECRHLAASTS